MITRPETITVSPLSTDHLSEIADIHSSAFSHSLLSRLGISAVRGYCEWQLIGPHESTAYGAWIQGELKGFVIGGSFKGAQRGFLKRYRWILLRSILLRPALLFKSELWRALKENSTRGNVKHAPKMPNGAQVLPRSRSYGILAIAVRPDSQCGGIGTRLMEQSEEDALARGFQQMHLTVATENRQAIRFYERLGWAQVDRVSGRTLRMMKQI